jgi:hypothetical protein
VRHVTAFEDAVNVPTHFERNEIAQLAQAVSFAMKHFVLRK